MRNNNKAERIGIITFHRTLNYGASLQMYALYDCIKSLGYDVEVVDYVCEAISEQYSLNPFRNLGNIKQFIKVILSYSFLKKRERLFNDFIKEKVSDKCYDKNTIKNSLSMYDTFVVGSDQVWNPRLTGGDMTYFLDFCEGKKKIAFAASVGDDESLHDYVDDIRELVDDFFDVFVREEVGKQRLERLQIGSNIKCVLDPTFLIDQKKWRLLEREYTKMKRDERYVLVYAQGRPKMGLDYALSFAKERGMEVIVVHNYARKFRGVKNIRDASIEQFIWLIDQAEFVVTTSFHGMAMAINLEKQFIIELKEEGNFSNERMLELVNLFNLNDNVLKDDSFNTNYHEIDYNSLNSKKNKYIEQSIHYLEGGLLESHE